MIKHTHVCIIGGGPAGLMAAEVLARSGLTVSLYDRMPSVGRKMLMAGRGGLNLTHDGDLAPFIDSYATGRDRLAPMITNFPPEALRKWALDLGIETFVGTSGRVFPVGMKASPLLRAWLKRLDQLGVIVKLKRRWTGWDNDNALCFTSSDGKIEKVTPDATLLALGGASWPRLGSDGAWTEVLKAKGLSLIPLSPSNCGFVCNWSPLFSERFAGQPIKSLSIRFGDRLLRGEVTITAHGIEGTPIYALSPDLRNTITKTGHATLTLDLKPDWDQATLTAKLSMPRGSATLSTHLRKTAGLAPVAINLLRESHLDAPLPQAAADLAVLIKNLPLTLCGVGPIERAISSAGGLSFDEVDQNLMVKKQPGLFIAGEMLDWEAPTGGYMLQGVMATAIHAAHGILDFLRTDKSS